MPLHALVAFTTTLLLAASLGWSQAAQAQIKVRDVQASADVTFVPGEVIVKLREGARGDILGFEAEVERETSGGEIVFNLASRGLDAMSASDLDDLRTQTLLSVRQLSAREEVEYAQPNWILEPARVPRDEHYPLQWHYRSPSEVPGGLGLQESWEGSVGSHQVTVAVIDTGILADHADIASSPNLAGGYDMISDPARAADGDGRDADPTDAGDDLVANQCGLLRPPEDRDASWHGTHVAGTVGVGLTDNTEGVAGTAWKVKVQSVRVLGKCGGTIIDINDAIRWAAGLPVPDVPANPTPADIINMSLGGRPECSRSPSTQSAIDDARAAGALVIAAAGNSAADAAGFTPASCDGVFTVAASDARGHLVTRYSNFGPAVDILAPGGDVQRDDDGNGHPDGVLSHVNGGYEFMNGTSMAAPHVAGVAALILARDSSLSADQVAQKLTAEATPRDGSQCPQPCGAGLLAAPTGGQDDVGGAPTPDGPSAGGCGSGFFSAFMAPAFVLARRKWARRR